MTSRLRVGLLALLATASLSARAELRAVFLGVSTIYLEGSDSAVLFDAFVSRYERARISLAQIAPDPAQIDWALGQAGIRKVDGIFVAHSHYDHALDAAEIAKRTGAVLNGSESTANIGRGGDLPETQIRRVREGELLRVGAFQVQAFLSPHADSIFHSSDRVEEIERPLVPPVHALRYKAGENYSYLAEVEGRRILIHASADWRPGMYEGKRADVVFLGVGRLGKRPESVKRRYWNEVVRATGARKVFLVHWDDFFRPLAEGLRPMPPVLDDVESAFKSLRKFALEDGVELEIPRALEPLALPPIN